VCDERVGYRRVTVGGYGGEGSNESLSMQPGIKGYRYQNGEEEIIGRKLFWGVTTIKEKGRGGITMGNWGSRGENEGETLL